MGLENFEKGNIENINPELGIDDQAELLPYDKKWEFPIEKLKLGMIRWKSFKTTRNLISYL